MSEEAGRYSWVVKLSRLAMVASLAVLGAKMILCVAAAVDVVISPVQWANWLGFQSMPPALFAGTFAAAAALVVICLAVLGLWIVTLYGCIRAWVSAEEAAALAASRLRTVETLLEDQSANSSRLVDLTSLSDQAKSLIYRDREIDAFRETVQADLTRQDYAAAAGHIEAIENRFGYAEEAARLRKEVEESRQATEEGKVDQAIRRLHAIVEMHDWARAQRETQRILQMFPRHPKVGSLPKLVEEARLQTKRSLLKQYKEAVDKKDVETAIRLLKELDPYLPPQEAAAWAESARGVFHAKLLNLGVQFSIHVADQRWDGALATGEEIMRDFPNSRMAQEVREKIGLLRQRAAAAAAPETGKK
jgi:outer membrane protein assembly factor BamD (BamD/ComL family)